MLFRSGSSAPLGSAGDVDALIDRAVQAVAAAHGVSVSKPSAGGGAGGAVVDSAALDAFAASVTGQQGVLATTARHVLAALGLDEPESYDAAAADEAAATRALVEAVDAELGTGWLKFATPVFQAERAVLIDDRWATAASPQRLRWSKSWLVPPFPPLMIGTPQNRTAGLSTGSGHREACPRDKMNVMSGVRAATAVASLACNLR